MMGKRKNDSWVTNYLQRDEEWQWVGKPDACRLLNWNDSFLIPFSLIWCSIAFGVVFSSVSDMGLAGLWTLLIPHVWIGLWLFPVRFIHEYLARKNTTYIVTNRRLIIISNLFGNHFKSYYIAQLPELDINDRKNNKGTIRFSGKSRFASKQHGGQSNASTDFYDIPDVWEVYHLIQDLHHESQFMLVEEVEYEYEYYEQPRKRYLTR